MATGASNAELAVLLVAQGLVEQTRRHAAIVALLGIRHVVLAVNKIDLVVSRRRALPGSSVRRLARRWAFLITSRTAVGTAR